MWKRSHAGSADRLGSRLVSHRSPEIHSGPLARLAALGRRVWTLWTVARQSWKAGWVHPRGFEFPSSATPTKANASAAPVAGSPARVIVSVVLGPDAMGDVSSDGVRDVLVSRRHLCARPAHQADNRALGNTEDQKHSRGKWAHSAPTRSPTALRSVDETRRPGSAAPQPPSTGDVEFRSRNSCGRASTPSRTTSIHVARATWAKFPSSKRISSNCTRAISEASLWCRPHAKNDPLATLGLQYLSQDSDWIKGVDIGRRGRERQLGVEDAYWKLIMMGSARLRPAAGWASPARPLLVASGSRWCRVAELRPCICHWTRRLEHVRSLKRDLIAHLVPST
jgi:hypothetical protein